MEAKTFLGKAERLVEVIFKNVDAYFSASPSNTVYMKINRENFDYRLFLKTEETEFTSKRDLLQIHFKIDVVNSKIILVENFTELTFEEELRSTGIQEREIEISLVEENQFSSAEAL